MGCKMTDEESERLTVLAETDGLTLGEWCRHVLLARADSERPRTIEETVLAEAFALRTIPREESRRSENRCNTMKTKPLWGSPVAQR